MKQSLLLLFFILCTTNTATADDKQTKPKAVPQELESVCASASQLGSEISAAVLMHCGQIAAKYDKQKSRAYLDQAFTFSRSDEISQRKKSFLQSTIFDLSKHSMAWPDIDRFYSLAEPEVQTQVLDYTVERALREQSKERAAEFITRMSRTGSFPYKAASRVMEAFGADNIARTSLFATALSSFERSEQRPIGQDFDFGDLTVKYWQTLPESVAIQAVDSLFQKAKEFDRQKHGTILLRSGEQTLPLHSAYEYRAFQLIPLLEHLQPSRARNLIETIPSLRGARQQFKEASAQPTETRNEPSVSSSMDPSQDEYLQRLEAEQRKIWALAKTAPKDAIMAARSLPNSRPDAPEISPRVDTLAFIAARVVGHEPATAVLAFKEIRKNADQVSGWAFAHVGSTMIESYLKLEDRVEAERTFSEVLSAVRRVYRIDADKDDPNTALKMNWPSTFLWSEMAVLGQKLSIDVVPDIPDPAITAIIRMRLLAHNEGVTLSGFAIEREHKRK